MRTIAAKEIKRRGMSAVDELLKDGAVYIIQHDAPAYVVLDPALYEELRESAYEGLVAGVRESEAEIRDGGSRSVTAEQLIAELGLRD